MGGRGGAATAKASSSTMLTDSSDPEAAERAGTATALMDASADANTSMIQDVAEREGNSGCLIGPPTGRKRF